MNYLVALASAFLVLGWCIVLPFYQARQRRIKLEPERMLGSRTGMKGEDEQFEQNRQPS